MNLLDNRVPARLCTVSLAALALGCGAGALPEPEPAPAVSLTRPLMHNGHDYLFVRSAMTWDQAGAFCDRLGYGLVTVNDAQEQAFLKQAEGRSMWWLGLRYTAGGFRWRDGTSSFVAWRPGQPDDVGRWGTNDCVIDNWSNYQLGQWDDYLCSGPDAYVICESLD